VGTAPNDVAVATPSAGLAWVRFGIAGLIAVATALGLLGVGLEEAAVQGDRQAHPPPGVLVSANEHRLHLHVEGQAVGPPTVVLESAAGEFSVAWARVQPDVARFTRVVAYDRSGLGWSELDTEPPTADRAVANLHRALIEADLGGPYVLVGDGLGAAFTRVFAQTYPHDVAGLVLIDPSGPELVSHGGPKSTPRDQTTLAASAFPQYVARVGLLRFFDPLPAYADELPPSVRQTARAFSRHADQLLQARAEVEQARDPTSATNRLLVRDPDLGAVPLTVLSSSCALDEYLAARRAAAQEVATLSSRGSLRVLATACRHSPVTAEQTAAQLVEEIRAAVMGPAH
jgi:pimeloyl-ACP methyl ester carboxylesterase